MLIPVGYGNVQVMGTTGNGRNWLTACGFALDAVGQEDADSVAELAAASFWAADYMAVDFSIDKVRVVVGQTDPSAPVVFESSLDLPVSGADAGLPANVAALVTKNTTLGGRRGRGRCYFPGLKDASVDNGGNITGDLAANPNILELFWEEITSGVTGDPWVPVLLHSDETAPSPIVSFSLATLVATQRRRLRG